MKDTKL